MTRLAVFDVGGTAIKYCAMEGTDIQLQGEVPTPDPMSHDQEPFLAALEDILAQLGPVEGIAPARCSTTSTSTSPPGRSASACPSRSRTTRAAPR